MGNSGKDPWTEHIGNALWDWINDEANRDKAADQRNQNLVQVHRDGWKQTATAITKGLGAIADAIRDHGRR